MLHIEKYAAVDIGSNAIRLLIATVIEKEGFPTQFKKTSLVRLPIRLGADVFLKGNISSGNYKRLLDAMQAYSLIIKTHNVVAFRACATSAMREAKNGKEIVSKLKAATGIDIQIIDGNDEAAIIASTDLKQLISDNKVFLYVDVGGGSTEFTVFANGKNIASHSFKLGTVRIINGMVEDTMWEQAQQWVTQHTKAYSKINVIGSGGNINSIYRFSEKKVGQPLSYLFMSNFYEKVKQYDYNQRVFELKMNPDRADVIIPATRIYLSAMKWAKAKNMYVPKIGLADGIVKQLYNERNANR
ncbi:exopolyphosphatase [Flavobacteriaceae bacterium]|nr:exopolyphosphatase [Flavobacteriaceae bacterium]MDB4114840.1 exopolyphosphatase [Flavobacteriaceae bacterium]MDB4121625.1 exopolyphosphatase [Flavobacteriaceae bacterium]MDB9796470.1 exopolyphosphatase [Flavobacteriaceae bacterium]MDB9858573.1 exopolyphosphatase [Flavobacteriaceae bacterium]